MYTRSFQSACWSALNEAMHVIEAWTWPQQFIVRCCAAEGVRETRESIEEQPSKA